MSKDLNQCSFIGRLGKDVEMKYMPSGESAANFSIAVGESWKDKQTGEKKEKTEWVNISCYGKLAEICGQYLKKGSKIYASGSMETRKWQDKATGQDKYSTGIKLKDMQMLDSANQQQGQQQAQAPQQSWGNAPQAPQQKAAPQMAPAYQQAPPQNAPPQHAPQQQAPAYDPNTPPF